MWSQQQFANEALDVVPQFLQLGFVLDHSEVKHGPGLALVNLLLLIFVHWQPKVVNHVLRVDNRASGRLRDIIVDFAIGAWSLVRLFN